MPELVEWDVGCHPGPREQDIWFVVDQETGGDDGVVARKTGRFAIKNDCWVPSC